MNAKLLFKSQYLLTYRTNNHHLPPPLPPLPVQNYSVLLKKGIENNSCRGGIIIMIWFLRAGGLASLSGCQLRQKRGTWDSKKVA